MPCLQDLPKELQDQIWREALVYDRPLHRKEALGNGTTSQLFVSKRIREEYAPVFWRENIFVMDLESPGKFMAEHWMPRFYTRSRIETMLGLPERRYTKQIRNISIREPFGVITADICSHLHTWIAKIMPNIVYMNINMTYSTNTVGWKGYLKDFWQIIKDMPAPKRRHIRLVRLSVLNLACLGPELDPWRDTPLREVLKGRDPSLRDLIDGRPLPFAFDRKLSFTGPGFQRGAIGGWACSAPVASGPFPFSGTHNPDTARHPSMIQGVFELEPRPKDGAFSRATGGPFATAKLEDFFEEKAKSQKPDDDEDEDENDDDDDDDDVEGDVLKLVPPNDVTEQSDYPTYEDFVKFKAPFVYESSDGETDDDVSEDSDEEFMEELRDEIYAEMRVDIDAEVREEVRKEMSEETREEIREQIFEDVWEEVRDTIEMEMREEFEEEIEEEIRGDLEIESTKERIRNEIREEIKDEIREEVWDEIYAETNGETREQIKEEVREEIREEIRDEIWEDVWDEIRDEIREEIKAKS